MVVGGTVFIQKNPVPLPPVVADVYSPLNLSQAFKIENLHVKITYKFDGNGYYCGIENMKLETITILKIEQL